MTIHYMMFNAEITVTSVQTFINWTSAKSNEGATRFMVAFSTNGGNVDAGLLMTNYIAGISQHVTMHNLAVVGSVGIPIFCAANSRIANPLSTFVFHGVGINTSERLDEPKLQQHLEAVKQKNDLIAQAIHNTSGMDYNLCRELLVGEQTRSSNWAMENGLCQQVQSFAVPAGTNLVNLF